MIDPVHSRRKPILRTVLVIALTTFIMETYRCTELQKIPGSELEDQQDTAHPTSTDGKPDYIWLPVSMILVICCKSTNWHVHLDCATQMLAWESTCNHIELYIPVTHHFMHSYLYPILSHFNVIQIHSMNIKNSFNMTYTQNHIMRRCLCIGQEHVLLGHPKALSHIQMHWILLLLFSYFQTHSST